MQDHVRLFNRLSELRYPARYLDRPLPLSEEEAIDMLKTANDMFVIVKRRAPLRGVIQEDTYARFNLGDAGPLSPSTSTWQPQPQPIRST